MAFFFALFFWIYLYFFSKQIPLPRPPNLWVYLRTFFDILSLLKAFNSVSVLHLYLKNKRFSYSFNSLNINSSLCQT